MNLLAWLTLLLDDVSSLSMLLLLMSAKVPVVVKRRTVGGPRPVFSIASSSNLAVEVEVDLVWCCCRSNDDAARFNPAAEGDDASEVCCCCCCCCCCCNWRGSTDGDGRRRSDSECVRQIDMEKRYRTLVASGIVCWIARFGMGDQGIGSRQTAEGLNNGTTIK